jgi:hypothetical protein
MLTLLLLWGAAFQNRGTVLSAQETGAEEPDAVPPEFPEAPGESGEPYPAGNGGESWEEPPPPEEPPFEEPGFPDDDDGGVPSEDYTGYIPDLYSRGDQFFSINLGLVFPTLFPEIHNGHNLNIPDYTGFLSYNFFINAHWYAGAELGGMFATSKGKNMLFIIPIGIRGGYQFVAGRFEFPVGISLGVAPQRYLDHGYPGFYMKGGGSAYFRFNPDWSFGLNAYWWWVPQWFSDPAYNVNGNFFEVTLSARYHF